MFGVYHEGLLIIGRNGQALVYDDEITAITVCAAIIRDRKVKCTVEGIQIKVL